MTVDLEYISNEDLDYLDEFLLYRIDENADFNGKDEGILGLSELDGLITAVVSGPVLIPPSQWLPVVWGDFEPEWKSEKEAEKVILLMINIMNSTSSTLMDLSNEFQPFFNEREADGKTYIIVDEWCEGYMRGVSLAQKQWDLAGKEMQVLLAPIKSFTDLTNWQAHEMSSAVEVDNIRNAIAPNAQAIHAYWLARREDFKPSASPVRRESPHVGRNDPCPCGSGKKYKKCCLH